MQTDAEIPAADLKQLVVDFKQIAERQSGEPFPTDVYQQLQKAIEAVFSSWNNKRAFDYRNFNKIPHALGTAVNVQSMVFGNMGNDSGTGVAFTRNPSTGEKELYGEYLLNAQGEDVVAGIRTPSKISRLQEDLPACLPAIPGDRPAPGTALSRHARPGIYRRKGPPLYAADALSQTQRAGSRESRRRYGRRRPDQRGRGHQAC